MPVAGSKFKSNPIMRLGQQVALHQRNLGMYQWNITLEHYLGTLYRKPGALHGSAALEQSLPQIKELYSQFFSSSPRGFIGIMIYCHQNHIGNEKQHSSFSILL